MFRLWGRLFKDTHMIKDIVIERDDDTRTHRVLRAVDEICRIWDLGRPVWLDTNIADFKKRSKTRFTQDNFIEQIDFDHLEIQVIEE